MSVTVVKLYKGQSSDKGNSSRSYFYRFSVTVLMTFIVSFKYFTLKIGVLNTMTSDVKIEKQLKIFYFKTKRKYK